MIDLAKNKRSYSCFKTLNLIFSKKIFFRILNIAFRFVGIKTYEMTICQTPCTFSGLKLHLGRNVNNNCAHLVSN